MITLSFAGPLRSKVWLTTMIAAFYALSGIYLLRDYIPWTSVNFIIGMISLPLIAGQAKRAHAVRFGWMSIGFSLIGLAVPVQTAYYMAVCCALLFIAEQVYGKLNILVFFTVVLMSPVMQYFAHVFSFPIRLWLTRVAGNILIHAGFEATVSGNMISASNGDFAVDPACMGLNMLITSLLCGLLMLAVYQRLAKKELRSFWTVLLLVFLLLLNVVANLVRILLLVWFRLLPDNPMHGISGILCLIVYVLIPASFIIRWLIKKKAQPLSQPLNPGAGHAAPTHSLHLLILPCLLIAGLKLLHKPVYIANSTWPATTGYTVSRYDDEITKLENAAAMIYLKPTRGFIYTDHNPLLCWTGCGYGFTKVEEQQWNGIPVFTGILSKGNETLYTAWWYDNGRTRTTSQVEWRWLMIKGSPSFTIVNVTAMDKATLMKEVQQFVDKKLL